MNPVTVKEKSILINPEDMKINVSYPAFVNGKTYWYKKTENNTIQIYEEPEFEFKKDDNYIYIINKATKQEIRCTRKLTSEDAHRAIELAEKYGEW